MSDKITTLEQWSASTLDEMARRCAVGFWFDPEEDRVHAVWERIVANEMPNLIDIVDDFRDDRLPCYIISFTYPDITYVVAFWWVTDRFSFDLVKATQGGIKTLRSFLKRFNLT